MCNSPVLIDRSIKIIQAVTAVVKIEAEVGRGLALTGWAGTVRIDYVQNAPVMVNRE